MTTVFVRPTTLEDVFAELEDDDAHVFAGGQSLVLLMNLGLFAPAKLVSLTAVPGLAAITVDGQSLAIGAMCTYETAAGDPRVAKLLPGASQMFRGIGNRRVRAAGTVGGNLVHADPAQDPPVYLEVMDAVAEIVGPSGVRQLAVGDVGTGLMANALEADEILTRVIIPQPESTTRAVHQKFLTGTRDDYATVAVSARVTVDASDTVTAVRLTAGAIGDTVVRLDDCVAPLIGQARDDQDAVAAVAQRVTETVVPHGDRRGSADYKRHLCGVVTARALGACLAAPAIGANGRGGR